MNQRRLAPNFSCLILFVVLLVEVSYQFEDSTIKQPISKEKYGNDRSPLNSGPFQGNMRRNGWRDVPYRIKRQWCLNNGFTGDGYGNGFNNGFDNGYMNFVDGGVVDYSEVVNTDYAYDEGAGARADSVVTGAPEDHVESE